MKSGKIKNAAILIYKMIIYNLRIIFANKFVWFLSGSILFWMGMMIIYAFNAEVSKMNDLFFAFLASGLLIVFYPSVFGIQNDQDARTIEILFGIPDYRYKVWFVRIVLILTIAFLIMMFFTFASSLLVVRFRFMNVTMQVMAPVVFLSLMAFGLSTVIRNGNGTAVVMIIIGLIFMIMSEPLRKSQWNLFMNPYEPPYDVNEASWAIIIAKNRIILSVGSVLFLLLGLFNLQKREKFM